MASKHTANCRRQLWLFRILDFLLLFVPVIVYVCIAFNSEISIAGKIALIGMISVALIVSIINLLTKQRLRCPIWLLLLGLFIAVKEMLLPLVIILAITNTLDDLFFTPIITYYRTKLIANKAIDERE